MFTGIIETIGTVKGIEKEGTNIHYLIESDFLNELKIDQSIAHNGACLTVVEITDDYYVVTAILETLQKTNLGDWKEGTKVNLERCLKVNDRLDGHMVQGHVDTIGVIESIKENNGSWELNISHSKGGLTVEKGSICVNGISLTVVNSTQNSFSVAIIPYTWEHTNLHTLKTGDKLNLEFDILGKYIQKLMKNGD